MRQLKYWLIEGEQTATRIFLMILGPGPGPDLNLQETDLDPQGLYFRKGPGL
jgi:hypothetical protein